MDEEGEKERKEREKREVQGMHTLFFVWAVQYREIVLLESGRCSGRIHFPIIFFLLDGISQI